MKFREEQKFTQWWLWLILIGVGIIPIFGIYQQILVGEPFGDKPMSDTGLLIFTLFTWGLLAMFYFMRLVTEIDPIEIRMNFIPFTKKTVKWSQVKSAKVVDYGFVGYGIRLGSKFGTIYNVKGRMGLAIELKNGNKFLIGTQRSTEIQELVDRYLQA